MKDLQSINSYNDILTEMQKRQVLKSDGVTISVKVQPRASRTEVVGEIEGAMKIRLAAPPVDGAANDELIRFLADTFAIPKRQIIIKSGLTSRNKIVHISGITEDDLKSLINNPG